MASGTERVQLATMFANNVVRSPSEFAAFAVTLHQLSDGRCEAGLGAGWSAHDARAAGATMTDSAHTARRYREALQVVAEPSVARRPSAGESYDFHDLEFAPVNDPPQLFAAVGGSCGARHIAPLVDRLEIFPAGPALRTSPPGFGLLAAVTHDDIRRLVDLARDANPNASIGVGLLVGAGDHPMVNGLENLLADSYLSRFSGLDPDVACALQTLHDEGGIDRIGVLPGIPGTVEALIPSLLGTSPSSAVSAHRSGVL